MADFVNLRPAVDPDVEAALLEIDFGVGGMLVPVTVDSDSEPEPREPISRAGLARLLAETIRECSATRLAYRVATALLAERTRELAALHARHERLIEEYRAHRSRHMQAAA